MRKNHIFIALTLAALTFTACSKEDALTPDYDKIVSYYEPSDTATDTISVARRNFFNQYGSYLLFTDTIQHVPLGVDFNGDMQYKTELLNLNYNVGGTYGDINTYRYDYLATDEFKLQSIAFLEEYIVPHLSDKMRPFSWALVDVIYCHNSVSGDSKPYAACGQRAFAVATGLLSKVKKESQKKQLADQILNIIIIRLSKNNASHFNQFYRYSTSLYGKSFNYSNDAENMKILNENGFISKGKSMWGSLINGQYPYQEDDMKAYATSLVYYDMATLEKKYADYPIIIDKFKALKECFEQVGYIFDTEKK